MELWIWHVAISGVFSDKWYLHINCVCCVCFFFFVLCCVCCWPTKALNRVKPGNEEMKTRSSASGDLVPVGNSHEAQLQIVDLTSSRGKSLHGSNRPRPSSRRSKGRVHDSVSESWLRSILFQIVDCYPDTIVEFLSQEEQSNVFFFLKLNLERGILIMEACFRFVLCAIEM